MRVVRGLGILAIAILVAGCKDATGPQQVTTGIDVMLGPSCNDVGTPNLGVEVWIDGALRDSVILSGHTRSQAVAASPGTHTIMIREYVNGYPWPGLEWPAQRVTVTAGEIRTVTLQC